MGESKSNLKSNKSLFDCVLAHPYIALLTLCLAITPLKIASINNFFAENTTIFIAVIGFSLLIIFAGFLYKSGRLNTKTAVVLIIIAGFLLRVLYILYTDLTERQHDIGNFVDLGGHASYISYLMHNKHLPDFDVREQWQFYHPPFFHSICAVWLMFLQLFLPANQTYECVQIVTLFCSSAIMIISLKLFKELNLKGAGLLVAMALVCFSPTFIYFAGTVNNDIMSVMFMLLSLLWALRWYKNRSFKNIILLALCIGFGMMTKLSCLMVAVPVALMFLTVFIKNIKQWKNYILQFATFGVISIPLGIWWEIRNYILFKVPLAFIPSVGGVETGQYLGDGIYTVAQRLFDFDFSQLASVYDKFIMFGSSYNEYNPTIGLFKTALFGERINDTDFPLIKFAGPLLFWSCVLLTIIAIIYMIMSLFKRNKNFVEKPSATHINSVDVDGAELQKDVLIKICLALFVIINLASYYVFCIKYPLTCTQHARYCMSVIPLLAMYLGIGYQKSKEKRSALCVIILITTVIFCLSSAYIYSVIY